MLFRSHEEDSGPQGRRDDGGDYAQRERHTCRRDQGEGAFGRLALESALTLSQVLAAHRAGIRTLLLPYKNEKDVTADLPPSVKTDLTFIYVRSIWEALEGAFGGQLWEGSEGEWLRGRVVGGFESRL